MNCLNCGHVKEAHYDGKSRPHPCAVEHEKTVYNSGYAPMDVPVVCGCDDFVPESEEVASGVWAQEV